MTSKDIRYTCFTKPDLRRLLRGVGMRSEAIGPEGTLGLGPTEPAYQSGPFGLATVHEVLASKPSER
jgi:hypothetical protein